MKIFKSLIIGTLSIACSIGFVADAFAVDTNLPVIEAHGVKYYYYKVQTGESIYGICKRNGWDESVLRTYNDNIADKVKKGQALYYPVSVVEATSAKHSTEFELPQAEPIKHHVKRGETVYSISRLYGVPIDIIYAQNPNSKDGIKAGETLIIAPEILMSNQPVFYTVKPGDTLYALAMKYNSSVESLMQNNPGVSEKNFKAGSVIKIVPNTSKSGWEPEKVEKEVIRSFNSQKVNKTDTWESIANSAGMSVDELLAANPGTTELKAGEWISVPNIQNITVTEPVFVPDNTEVTVQQRDSIYREVHRLPENMKDNVVDVTVVLENVASKSNIEFLRGFLMGVDTQKNAGYKINMRAINGSELGEDDSEFSGSNLIIGVYDNEFPIRLADIAKNNGIEVVNVFDTKNDFYETNPYVIQMLQPLDYFNDVEQHFISDRFKGKKVIFTGNVDNSDKLGEIVKASFPTQDVTYLTKEELAYYPFEDSQSYMIYMYPTKKEEIEEVLDSIIAVLDNNSMTRLSVVGRPQWVAYAESLGDKFARVDTYIPSRFFMRPEGSDFTTFSDEYKKIYNQNLSNSYPQYAILGYDIANFFLPTTAYNHGDYNAGLKYREGVQNDIDINRINNWGGFININAYMIHVTPMGNYEKIEIK